ncbi:UNVERIFIED_CONTAM: hypothetical protein GTU68_037034, partial [Idotea baltica]|nr:hypothetical protein [Idotea baltica]
VFVKTKFDINHETKQQSFRNVLARSGVGAESIRRFQEVILYYYRYRGRSFPWRLTREWYPVLVSEIMSQQTQVARVLPKFEAFLSRFPEAETLAKAKGSEVTRAWQGLGYNRRGLGLQRCVREVLEHFDGELPNSEEHLLSLPGVGPYTAAALQVFVFNSPVVVVETNIRAVLIYFFLAADSSDGRHCDKTISEAEIFELASRVRCLKDSHRWNSAMMDYGAMLKARGFKSNHLVDGYKKQSQFKGSFRQVRGAVLRTLSKEGALSGRALNANLKTEVKASARQAKEATKALLEEGFIVKREGSYQLSD